MAHDIQIYMHDTEIMISGVWYSTQYNSQRCIIYIFFKKQAKVNPHTCLSKNVYKKKNYTLLQNQYSHRYTKNLRCK